ncbi:hypothetical protein [Pseudanabaena minima]|uniref:hypothetical protein n=1 Tax=Pseudanabaena minima TaxID=890415 RepID=UPI003DA81AE6
MLTKFPSIREQLQATGYFASLAKSVACQCKPNYLEHCDRDGLFFTCELCLRDIPYCFGADDDHFDYCDDCASEVKSNG